MDKIRATLPLTAEEAYWHACTGMPYALPYVAFRIDRDGPEGLIYFLKNQPPQDEAEHG